MNITLKSFSKSAIKKVLNATVESGRIFAKRFNLPFPLMYAYHDVPYLGNIHYDKTIVITASINSSNILKRYCTWFSWNITGFTSFSGLFKRKSRC